MKGGLFKYFSPISSSTNTTKKKKNDSKSSDSKENHSPPKKATSSIDPTPIKKRALNSTGTTTRPTPSKKAKMSVHPDLNVTSTLKEGSEKKKTTTTQRKRLRRVVMSDDDDDDDDVPIRVPKKSVSKSKVSKKKKRKAAVSDSEEEYNPDSMSESESESEEEELTKMKRKKQKTTTSSFRTPKVNRGSASASPFNFASFSAQSNRSTTPSTKPRSSMKSISTGKKKLDPSSREALKNKKPGLHDGSGTLALGQHMHNSLRFLKPEFIKDKNGNRPDDPEYDPTTLYVPEHFLKDQTPAQRQWWEFKSVNFDTILFFKVGKFYEIFNMDADITVKALDGSNGGIRCYFMRGRIAHCGWPEIAYGKFSNALVEQGLRVGRVEQTETPDQLKAHNKSCLRKEKRKVVLREMCSLLTPGTRTFSFLDSEGEDKAHRDPQLLLVLYELNGADRDKNEMESGGGGGGNTNFITANSTADAAIGFVIVDAAAATFRVGQFMDDPVSRSCLITLLVQTQPREILCTSKGLSRVVKKLVKVHAPADVLISKLRPCQMKCWSSSFALDVLKRESFLGNDISKWPNVLQQLMKCTNNDDKCIGEMSLAALGGCLSFLDRCLIGANLVSHRRFAWMSVDNRSLDNFVVSSTSTENGSEKNSEPQLKKNFTTSNVPLSLDGTTLTNLEILMAEGATDAYRTGGKGSLLGVLEHTASPMGKRLLQQWICAPLRDVKQITKRLDAVSELMSFDEPLQKARLYMRKVPDMQRLLASVHALGQTRVGEEETALERAVMYEEVKYSQRKVKTLVKLIDGLKDCQKAVRCFTNVTVTSSLLKSILEKQSGDESGDTDQSANSYFPDITEKLQQLVGCIGNIKEALQTGKIIPPSGTDDLYDEALIAKEASLKELEEYRKDIAAELGIHHVKYFGSNKHRYQLEVPEKTNMPAEFTVTSKKKGFRRYRSAELESLIKNLDNTEEEVERCLRDAAKRVFHKFDRDSRMWEKVSQSIAILDCLCCFALFSKNASGEMCRPIFVDTKSKGERPVLKITNAWHPCVVDTFSGGDFIPNSLDLSKKPALLLTGPNMGGKSTLLRQTCIAVLLAQIGCYVPAEAMELSLVDRIFTRLGASDKLMAGQSTFFVELSETSEMLRQATEDSLLIVDELGRGTSTFDGTAIASAVLEYLASTMKPRVCFCTHYHGLVATFGDHSAVQLGHMSSYVDPDDEEQKVTFLYKLKEGACPKSYGLNVARLARIPEDVVNCAKVKSEDFEKELKARDEVIREAAKLEITDLCKEALQCKDDNELVALWEKVEKFVV
eukprot:g3696.t1